MPRRLLPRSRSSLIGVAMVARTKEELLLLTQANQDQIKAFGVSKLSIFGSFARGRQGEESDVDVLVEFRPGRKTFDAFIHLALFLEDLFRRPVELVTPDSLSPYIGPHILSETEYLNFSAGVPTPYHQRGTVSDVTDSGLDKKDEFLHDETLKRAFVRSLEVIGEAAKQVPDGLKQKYSHVEWRAMAGMRDRLIHGYFGVDYNVVWDAVTNKVPVLHQEISEILQSEGTG
jgi:uncharacterized protein with HEPN domain/predicted nucleotidyltransferase